MQSLIRFLLRYHLIILFLFLEGTSFGLVVMHHKDSSRFWTSANTVMGSFYSFIDSIFGYINLKDVNEELMAQNAKLLNSSFAAYKIDSARFWEKNDPILEQQYEFMAATVINNSVHKYRNFITLDKGLNQGVDKDMAVISSEGVVGVVVKASDNFALVISMLNVDAGLSAKLKNTNFFGSVSWNGKDPMVADLTGIPSHAELQEGDTIITSGFSAIFPEGIEVGKVLSYQQQAGTKLYDVTIEFSEDFSHLKEVMVVKNLLKKEQLEVEEEIQ